MPALTPKRRLKLLEEVFKNKISVTSTCAKFGVSRFTFYKWAKNYNLKSSRKKNLENLSEIKGKVKRFIGKIPREIEDKVKKIAVQEPHLSKYKIAEKLKKQLGDKAPGIHGVYNILKRQGLNTSEGRLQLRKFVIGVKRKLSPELRLEIIQRSEKLRIPILWVCRDFGISRQTYYKWYRRWKKDRRIDSLKDKLPRFDRTHLRVSKEIENAILEIIIEYPNLSKYHLTQKLRQMGISLSPHGVYNVLLRRGLNQPEARLAYSSSRAPEVAAPVSWVDRVRYILEEFVPSLAPAPPPVISTIFNFLKVFSISSIVTSATIYSLLWWANTFFKQFSIGLIFATIALFMGSVFFLYSIKYYLTLAIVLSFSQTGQGERQDLPAKAGVKGKRGGFLNWIMGIGNGLRPGGPPYGSETGWERNGRITPIGLEPNLEHIQLKRYPFISVHIPLYNERNVVERVIAATTNFQYQGEYEVILCDDSTDETSQIIRDYLRMTNAKCQMLNGEGWELTSCEVRPGVTLKHLHRTSRSGFKGGALKLALKHTDPRCEFVSVFDADFVPYPDTLELFLKYFQATAGTLDTNKLRMKIVRMNANNNIRINSHDISNSQRHSHIAAVQPFDSLDTARDKFAQDQHLGNRIAAVQGYQWHVLNKSENWITRGVRSEYAGSYVIERSGGEIYSALKQISGAVYMIRRDVLEEVGWEESITEDFQLTLKLYEKGYKVVYTPYIQAPAECVSTIKRLIRQRMRWAEGHSNNIRRMFTRLLFGHWEISNYSDLPNYSKQIPNPNLPAGKAGDQSPNLDIGHSGIRNSLGQLGIRSISNSHNGNRVFVKSPLTLSEKLEFLYLSPYYLQAFFFLIGTISWLISETIFAARLPFWTSLWGWSLVLTNLLSLPLMNSVGLFLEESEERDYQGILAFIALSYILVPFQAYAALKGFLERKEGPWFRTPKTGRITDIVTRGRFFRLIAGILPGRVANANALQMKIVQMNANISINSQYSNSPTNSYLSLATANSRFDSFKIRPKGYRFVGNLVLTLALISSLSLTFLGTNIKTGSLADLPIQTRVEKVKEDSSFVASLFNIFSPIEVMAATDKVQDVLVSGVKQVPIKTLIISFAFLLILILAFLIHLYKKKRKFFKKGVKFVFIFGLILAWLLSGWPVIWKSPRFPPAIKEARAAIFETTASADVSLSSASDTLLTSMTLTPGAGDYLAVFTMEADMPATCANEIVTVSLYVNGSQVSNSERTIECDSSLNSAAPVLLQIATHAHVSPGAGQAVEVRYRLLGTGVPTGQNRSLTLFPSAAANFSEVTDGVNATIATTTETLLTNMTITPGAGDYLAVFSAHFEGASGDITAFMLYVGGSKITHTDRTFTAESSWAASQFTVLIAAKVSPTAGQAVEVRWARPTGSGTDTTRNRALTLLKMNSSDIAEASATGDVTSTSTTFAAFSTDLTVTPGAGNWLAFFGGSQHFDTVASPNDQQVDYSFFVNAVQNTNSERGFTDEESIDISDIIVYTAGLVSPTAGQAVNVQWRVVPETSALTRTMHERTLVLVRAPTFNQSGYRFFNNNIANDTDVGAVLANRDTAATLTSDGQDFRLRLLIHISDAQLALNGQNFKLQIASKVGGSCDTNMSTTDESYSDLSPSSGTIRYYDDTDSAKTDGADLTFNTNDPTHSTDTVVDQDYEEANDFTDTVAAVPAAEDGKWDFSIVDFSAAANTTFCLRVVESGGTVLTTYTVVPEFTTVPENGLLMLGLAPILMGMIKRYRRRKRYICE